jgi:hypothetical protein
MRLPIFATALVALGLASVTAVGISTVRPGAPRERERAVRMTRAGGQRLDSGEAVFHCHEDPPSFLIDASSEPAAAITVTSDLDPKDDDATPARVQIAGTLAGRPMAARPPRSGALGSSVIPRLTGRAPPSL